MTCIVAPGMTAMRPLERIEFRDALRTAHPDHLIAPVKRVLHHVPALDELNVPKTEQDELVDLLRPMRADIVEVESPETGTPLPDSYQAAPPLR